MSSHQPTSTANDDLPVRTRCIKCGGWMNYTAPRNWADTHKWKCKRCQVIVSYWDHERLPEHGEAI